MKRMNTFSKQDSYRKGSFKENSSNKNSYYNNNNREEQKSSFNFIQQAKLRIVQENLVSVTGLSTDFDDPDLLCDNEHFGKYGNVNKLIISTQGKYKTAFIQVYITFDNIADAAFTIKAMDGIKIGGREISATFGTTKYCTYFLKQIQCRNDKCFYLHQFDTKNELVDGVKNNLDFLDEKAEKIINKNLKIYLEKQIKQLQMKQQSEFPSFKQTIQYLIDQKILKKDIVDKLRSEIKSNLIEKKLIIIKSHEEQQQQQQQQKQKQKTNDNHKNISNNSPIKNKKQHLSNTSSPKKSLLSNNNISNNNNNIKNQNSSIINSNLSNQSSSDQKYDDFLLQEQEQNFIQSKNKKCNSLSTAPSPTKKNSQIEEQSIDRTIEKRIINQIMKNKLIYKSKMEFATHAPHYAKEENNKIINYVRKHLLNEV